MMHIFANPLLADMALISDDRGNPKSILATLAEGAYIDTLKAPEMKLFPGAEEEKPSFSFRVKLAQDGKEIASQFVKSSAYEFEDMKENYENAKKLLDKGDYLGVGGLTVKINLWVDVTEQGEHLVKGSWRLIGNALADATKIEKAKTIYAL